MQRPEARGVLVGIDTVAVVDLGEIEGVVDDEFGDDELAHREERHMREQQHDGGADDMNAGMHITAGRREVALAADHPAGLQQVIGDVMLDFEADEQQQDQAEHQAEPPEPRLC